MADKIYRLCFEMTDGTTQSVEFTVPRPGEFDIPAYWQSALDSGVTEINSAMQEAGRNRSAFLFYTDAHWNYNSKMSPNLLKYLYQHTGMTKTFFGGDIVLNESTDEDAMAYLWQWRAQLKGLPNHHSVVGNHDDGNTTNNLFSEQYVYNYLLAAEETPDIVYGDNGLYYYIDNPAEKTRYLFLDTAFKMVLYDAAQVQFIVDALKSTSDGWHIVAVAHIWYNTADDDTVGELSYGGTLLLNLFDDYNGRESGTMDIAASSTDSTATTIPFDFTDCGGKVEFCVGGHTHWDYDGASPGGIPVILCETDSTLVRSGLDNSIETVNESAVSGIIADYDTGKITVIRVGRGKGRVINGGDSGEEEPETPVNYTNVLDEVGYKDNTRWSNSSGAETTATGWDLTGFIPAVKGDVLRLQNITWYPTSENDGRGGVVWFDSNKTALSNSNFTSQDSLTNWSPVYDDAGNIVQITVADGVTSSAAYIRICCQDLNENSIITVNEVIE